MTDIQIDRAPGEAPITVRINGAHPDFLVETDRIAATMLSEPEPLLEDLLEIACAVFAADGTISRGGPTRPDMGTAWRRSMTFNVPVREPDFWSRTDVAATLTGAVSFLTEDDVAFRFTEREDQVSGLSFLQFGPPTASMKIDEVILFSGGLDSFAGALEALSTRPGNVCLVTHRSAQKMIPHQDRLGKYLAKRFPGRVLHIQIRASRKGTEARETTQRSRSFLFFALGTMVARMLGAPRLRFYENGVVSQNLPISSQVIGAMATRTTHPLVIAQFRALAEHIAPGGLDIGNPFVWLTKTEIVERIRAHGGEDEIRDCVSCTHIREQDTLNTHCGACSQCLDRRFAILAATLADEDPAVMYATDVLMGARGDDHSQIIALDWTRHALRLEHMQPSGFMEAFGHDLLRIARGFPETARAEVLQRSIDLQKRHGAKVREVLVTAIQHHAGALVDASLPPTSLLRMHAAGLGGEPVGLPPDPRIQPMARPARVPRRVENEADLVPVPDMPLEVTFSQDQGKQVVIVKGLCRVSGKPASLAHALKAQFDDDRKNLLPRDDHRFITAGDLAKELTVTKNAIAVNARRCRREIAEAYQTMHGQLPAQHLLIQSRPSSGFRIDPDIRVISAEPRHATSSAARPKDG